MGTRNLTVVLHDGDIKMAQYGQFDGYPEGVGKDIAEVLKKKSNLPKLRKAMDRTVFVKEDDEDSYPLLDRDYSGGKALAEILKNKGKGPIELIDSSNFAADSLFCEWCYIVDLDNEMVEVYRGFNKSPLTKEDRFHYLQPKAISDAKKSGDKEIFYPIRLWVYTPIDCFTPEAMLDLRNELNTEED